MDINFTIGDLVENNESGERVYVKYPFSNGTFLDEINDRYQQSDFTIVEKNETLKDLDTFKKLEVLILRLFNNGKNKNRVFKILEDKYEYKMLDIEDRFKYLQEQGYLMKMYKDSYLSWVLYETEQKQALKVKPEK